LFKRIINPARNNILKFDVFLPKSWAKYIKPIIKPDLNAEAGAPTKTT
jgi:hypothetical protein